MMMMLTFITQGAMLTRHMILWIHIVMPQNDCESQVTVMGRAKLESMLTRASD